MSARTRLRVAFFCQAFGYFGEALGFRQRLHVVCVELARGELSVPAAVLFWINSVETDVERCSNWHKRSFRFWNRTPILTRMHRLCKTIVASASRTGLSARQFSLHKLKSRVYLETRVQLDYARQRERGKQRAGRD